MNTIKLNNNEFEVESYSKTTYFVGEGMSSTATLVFYNNNNVSLDTEFSQPITSIEIYHNEDKIYELKNINSRVDNMTEYLNDNHMNVNVTIVFEKEE